MPSVSFFFRLKINWKRSFRSMTNGSAWNTHKQVPLDTHGILMFFHQQEIWRLSAYTVADNKRTLFGAGKGLYTEVHGLRVNHFRLPLPNQIGFPFLRPFVVPPLNVCDSMRGWSLRQGFVLYKGFNGTTWSRYDRDTRNKDTMVFRTINDKNECNSM